jgi:hypothetical protein
MKYQSSGLKARIRGFATMTGILIGNYSSVPYSNSKIWNFQTGLYLLTSLAMMTQRNSEMVSPITAKRKFQEIDFNEDFHKIGKMGKRNLSLNK